MGCSEIPTINYAQTSLALHEKAVEKHIPILSEIEITSRCNLRCVHCYIRDIYSGNELSYDEICDIFDQIADAGCLWLVLTGGEPLVRHDFMDIYSYAKQKGFIITLFSNGTLFTPSIVDFLAERPPFVIDTTMYGMTAETYEKMTRIPGSFDRFMNGIELLLERHLPLKLKTLLTNINAHEFLDMLHFARNLGVEFRFDAMINKKKDGSDEPTQYRLTPEEIVSLELADTEIAERLSKDYARIYGIQEKREYLYPCGAGRNSVYITSDGKLNLCTLSSVPGYDLRSGSFQDGFKLFPEFPSIKPTRESECQSCPERNICGQCPVWGELEHGDPEAKVEFLCKTARLRVETFLNHDSSVIK